jgi:hypothetical protein
MRTFVDQPTQIFNSDTYNDALLVGDGLQTGSLSLEDDLNALRTQIRQLLWAGMTGSWYDMVTQVSGGYGIVPARGVNTLGSDLADLEQHRFLFRRQNLTQVNIATGSNFALLSVSLGTAPASPAVVGLEPYATGTLVALAGTYGAFSIEQVSGSSAITPKNLVIVRDAWTHSTLTTSLGGGQEIFGLMQAEPGVATGNTFDDVSNRTQISFIYEKMINGTSSLAPVPASDIGGRTINYAYISRTDLKDLPEDAYLSNNIFIDIPQPITGGSVVTLADITLQRAIDNQGATVVVDTTGTNIQLAAGTSWTFLSGTQQMWSLFAGPTYTEMIVSATLATFVNDAVSFKSGITVGTGSNNPIDIGASNPGVISSALSLFLQPSVNLSLNPGGNLQFNDQYGTGALSSSINFSNSIAEWDQFGALFGAGTSILGAFDALSSSIYTAVSGALHRKRAQAGTTGAQFINPNVNVTYPTNLDAPLLSYVGRDFAKDLNIYLNGILLVPGTSAGNANDVYPGTSAATGDLKFPMKIRSGSVITMEVFTGG